MAETLTLALAMEIALRVLPFSLLLSGIDRLTPRQAEKDCFALDRLRLFVSVAYQTLPVQTSCLRESLVLYALLRRRGRAPRLCLGVVRNDERLAAHAWVECVGLDAEVHAFSPLMRVAAG